MNRTAGTKLLRRQIPWRDIFLARAPTMLGLAAAVMFLAPELPVTEASTLSLAGPLLAVALAVALWQKLPRLWALGSREAFALVPAYFVGASVVYFLLGELPALILLAALQWAVYAGYFLVPAAFGPRDRDSFLQVVLPLLLGLYALAAIWSAVFGPVYPFIQKDTHLLPGTPLFRAVATGENPNACAVALVTTLGAPLFVWKPRLRFLKTLLVGTVVLALLLTASRAGWLALALAATVCLVLLLRGGTGRGWVPVALVLIAALAGIYITLAMAPIHALRAVGVEEFGIGSDLLYRLEVLWTRGIEVFRDASVPTQIFGRGFRNTSQVYFEGDYAVYGSYHSSWLQFLLDGGVVGLALLVSWILMVAVRAVLRRGDDRGLAAIWTVVAIVVASTTENFLYGTTTIMLLGLATWLAFSPPERTGPNRG